MAQEIVASQADIERGESEYDTWFRKQAEIGVREANDPNTVWVSHDQVMSDLDELRATWRSQAEEERNVA
jgi:hypothetical protein